MFLVVPERVTVLPNVTAVALVLIVRFVFCLPGLGGGLAATAGPAQTNSRASAAPNFFIARKRSAAAQVDAKKEAPGGASLSARRAGRRRRTPRIGRGSGRRRVFELLFGAEEGVKRLLAQALAEHERQADADDDQQKTAAASPSLLRRAQALGS